MSVTPAIGLNLNLLCSFFPSSRPKRLHPFRVGFLLRGRKRLPLSNCLGRRWSRSRGDLGGATGCICGSTKSFDRFIKLVTLRYQEAKDMFSCHCDLMLTSGADEKQSL